MTRSIATQENVWTAADALSAEGSEPSLASVRARIGGGSNATIGPHLRTWFARRDEVAALVVPEEILARGSALIRELFWSAQRTAQDAVAEPLQRIQMALKTSKAQQADADAETARLERVEQDQLTEIARQAEHIRTLEVGLAAQQATTKEKVLLISRLESQLGQCQQTLAERVQEVAMLRASAAAAEALEGRLETLQRSVHVLANSQLGTKGKT